MDDDALTDELLSHVPADLRDRWGGVFYTGRAAWNGNSSVYLMGINPGGGEGPPTVAEQAAFVLRHENPNYSAYRNEQWTTPKGRLCEAGQHFHQRRVLHLLASLDLDPGTVPASNMVFVRSRQAHHIEGGQMRSWADLCWPFHEAMIERLGVRVVVCFGGQVAAFVRAQVGSHVEVDRFTETYNNTRPRVSRTFIGGSVTVVQVSHPSRADWQNPAADISPLVANALIR